MAVSLQIFFSLFILKNFEAMQSASLAAAVPCSLRFALG